MAGVRSLFLATALTCLLPAAMHGTAQAKGEDDLGVNDPRAYTPGETVRATITTVGSRRNLPTNREFLRDYLAFPPDGRYVVSFRPSIAPPKSADYTWVPAAISFIRHRTWAEVRLVFQVPSIPSGRYVVRGCWVPCTKRSLIGRTVLAIAQTEREALLLFRLTRAEAEARNLRTNSRLLRTRVIHYRNALDSTKERLAERSSEVEDLANRVWVLERKRENLEQRSQEPLATQNTSPALLAWALVVGACAGAVAVTFLRRDSKSR